MYKCCILNNLQYIASPFTHVLSEYFGARRALRTSVSPPLLRISFDDTMESHNDSQTVSSSHHRKWHSPLSTPPNVVCPAQLSHSKSAERQIRDSARRSDWADAICCGRSPRLRTREPRWSMARHIAQQKNASNQFLIFDWFATYILVHIVNSLYQVCKHFVPECKWQINWKSRIDSTRFFAVSGKRLFVRIAPIGLHVRSRDDRKRSPLVSEYYGSLSNRACSNQVISFHGIESHLVQGLAFLVSEKRSVDERCDKVAVSERRVEAQYPIRTSLQSWWV